MTTIELVSHLRGLDAQLWAEGSACTGVPSGARCTPAFNTHV
jgi:hypothetical protein